MVPYLTGSEKSKSFKLKGVRMSKYGKYTGGQWEAIGNIIGGEKVLDGLLRGEVEFVIVSAKKPASIKVMVTCQREGGSRCSVCHSQIADGDDICQQGHETGHQYEVPA